MVSVDFTMLSAQTRAFKKFVPGNRVCNAWGRGTGKSFFARMSMYLLVSQWEHRTRKIKSGSIRGVRVYYLLPTFKHFKRLGHAQKMLDELGPGGDWSFLGATIDKTEWTFRFPGGSFIQVLTAEASNRGARADAVVIDEADEIPIAKYESEVGPWFTEPHSLKMVLITGTPMRGRFGLLWKAFSVWPYGDATSAPAAGHYSFHATVYDASPEILDRTEADRAKQTINPVRFETEYLCNFDSGEGLVYPFFDASFHVREPPRLALFHAYIVGVDYGFNDPSVFVVIGVAGQGKDTICHILREWYVTGKSATELAAIASEIAILFPGAKWYADHDPTNTKTIKDDAHVDIVAAEKGDVEDGVTFVADALFIREDADGRRWTQLYVDPSCRHTIEEFGLYRRKRDSKDKTRVLDDIDTSGNDHCLDAIRYALCSHFAGPDKRVWIG